MRKHTLVGALVGLALIAAACGSDDTEPVADAPATSEAPVVTDAPETTEAVPATTEAMEEEAPATTEAMADDEMSDDEMADDMYPQAIISLSPTATEMLYAIGAGDQVIAVDDFSTFPEAAASKMQGINGWEPNVEAIAALEPDLIVTDGTNPDFLAQLDTLGIEYWDGYAATGFDDVYIQIEQLGAVTGNIGEAAELVGQMQIDVAAVIEGLPQLDEPLTYYHELDPTFFSVTSDTFIGAVYAEMGLVNIADAVGEGNPYPQLSAEFILTENPDLIFLACTLYCGETAETVAARPGWDVLDAITNGGVIEMNDDIASRWGPRIVEYLQAAGEAVTNAAALVPAG